MIDIVKRLRGDPDGNEAQHLLDEAADEIERGRKWIEQLQYEVKNYADENAKLREALEEIAHIPIDSDAPHYPVSLALAALEKKKEWE